MSIKHVVATTPAVRGLAVALASVVTVSSTALGVGAVPAFAQPTDDTTVVDTFAPTEPVLTEAPPEAPVVTEAPLVTEAPVTTPAPEVVTTEAPQPTPTSAEPEPTPTEAVTTATTAATTSAPVTTATTSAPETTPSTESTSPTSPTSSADETSTSATSGTSTTATTASTSASETSSEETTSVGTTAGSSTEQPGTSESTVEDSGSIEQAAGVTATPEPQQAEAPAADIAKAQDATPVEADPAPAPPEDIDNLKNLILAPPDENGQGGGTPPPDATLAAAEAKVVQWQPDWVKYDEYFRPQIFNPYPEPLQLVYDVGGEPRMVLIPPFGQIVTEVPEAGSYNFSALRLNVFGIPIEFAVGNFFGGGYFPGPGLPPPPPPPPVRTLTDVPVQVKYTDATYRPIVVRKIVDVGPDPSQGGAHKVLLDGVTPAWGEWKQNEAGVPQFEVHQTQSFPGMEAPAQGPLPGNYDLQLVSDSKPTGLSGKDITLIVAAAMAAAVGIGAIVLTGFLGRRRRPQH